MESNVLEMEDYKPVWVVVTCNCKCGKDWIAVAHKDSEALECPQCHELTTNFNPVTEEEYENGHS